MMRPGARDPRRAQLPPGPAGGTPIHIPHSGGLNGPRSVDWGKPGSKMHVLWDANGLPLIVVPDDTTPATVELPRAHDEVIEDECLLLEVWRHTLATFRASLRSCTVRGTAVANRSREVIC